MFVKVRLLVFNHPRIFCAGIGPLQHGVMLVLFTFIMKEVSEKISNISVI